MTTPTQPDGITEHDECNRFYNYNNLLLIHEVIVNKQLKHYIELLMVKKL